MAEAFLTTAFDSFLRGLGGCLPCDCGLLGRSFLCRLLRCRPHRSPTFLLRISDPLPSCRAQSPPLCRLLGRSLGGTTVSAFSAGVAFAAFGLTAAQRFFAASTMRLRAAGLSLRRLTASWAGAAACATGVAGLTSDKRERTFWSFRISASIASMIKFVSIAASLGGVFVYRNTIACRLSFEEQWTNEYAPIRTLHLHRHARPRNIDPHVA